MKYKRLLFIGLICICCGFTDKYTISYDNNVIKEKIEYYFNKNVYSIANDYLDLEDGDFIEADIVYSDIKATADKNYVKEFSDNGTKVTLTAEYDLDEYKNAYNINSCFENVKFYRTNKYYVINLSGKLLCENFETLEFISNDKVKTNSDSVNGNIYTWNLKETNNIEISIRKISEEFKLIIYILIVLLVIVLTGGTYIIIKSKKNNTI